MNYPAIYNVIFRNGDWSSRKYRVIATSEASAIVQAGIVASTSGDMSLDAVYHAILSGHAAVTKVRDITGK